VKTPWWLPLLTDATASVFDFSSFAALRPGGGATPSDVTPTVAELDSLDDADDATLRAIVEEAQTAAEAQTASDAEALSEQIAQLDASRKELETDHSAARQVAERAGDGPAGEADRSRARRLAHCIEVNARQRAALACRQVFKAADGFKAAFGGGGVLVGVGEMVDDSVEVGVHVALDAAASQKADSATLRVRVGAPGPMTADGQYPQGGARVVVRLSKLGVRGENGVPGIVNINGDSVTVNVEFTLRMGITYKSTGGGTKAWVSDGVHLDIHRLDQKVNGLVLADTGLPLLEMPEGLLRLVLSLLIPRSVEDMLTQQLAPELGDYLLASGCGSASVVAAMSTRGAPLAVIDANMCNDGNGGDAPAAASARQLAQLADAKAAEVLAQALTDWKQLGLSLGPDPRKHLLLGLPAGDAGVERGRVSLGDLQRYAHRISAWGPKAEKAFGLLWDRALAAQQKQKTETGGAAPQYSVRVSAALHAARALGRRPVRGVMTLHSLHGGVNVHAAARASAAAERRRGASGESSKVISSTFEQLLSNLDAAAANITRSSVTVGLRMEAGVMHVEASRVRHEGPVSVWTTLPLLRSGLLDLRRTTSRRPHPPLPLLLRATVETRRCVRPTEEAAPAAEGVATTSTDTAPTEPEKPAASDPATRAESEPPVAQAVAAEEADEEEDVVRLDAFCPHELCTTFEDALGDAGEPSVAATDADGKPLGAVLAGELSGLQCGLVVDLAALTAAAAADAAEASAPSTAPEAVPALTLHVSAAKDGVQGFDAALHAAPGVRLQLALRRAAATLHVGTVLRVVCRYLTGLGQRLANATPDPVPGAAPVAVLLRIVERYLYDVRFSAMMTAGASVNAKGELILEADMKSAGSCAPLVLDAEFKMSDVEAETKEMLTAVSALHAMRSRMAWTMPNWAKPPPMRKGRQEEEEPKEEAVSAQPVQQQQGGFQLPFQNDIGNFIKGIPGMPR